MEIKETAEEIEGGVSPESTNETNAVLTDDSGSDRPNNAAEAVEEFSFDRLKPKIKPLWKVVFLIILLACIGVSLYFSFNALSLDTYEYEETAEGWKLIGFHNDGTTKEIVIDYVMVKKGVAWEKDLSRPVVSVGKYALCCDNTIKKITIGKEVKSLEEQAFYSCKNLRYIGVEEGNASFVSEEGVLFTADKTEIILFPISYVYKDRDFENEDAKNEYENVSYVVPDTVVKVGALCFAYAERVSSIKLSAATTHIGTLAFFKCASLSSIELPDGLEVIDSDAFSYCKNLTYMYIPASVKEIGHHAFYECAGLTELHLGASESEFKNVVLGDYWKNSTLLTPITLRYGQERRAA